MIADTSGYEEDGITRVLTSSGAELVIHAQTEVVVTALRVVLTPKSSQMYAVLACVGERVWVYTAYEGAGFMTEECGAAEGVSKCVGVAAASLLDDNGGKSHWRRC